MNSIPNVNYIKIVDKNYDVFFKFIIDNKNNINKDNDPDALLQ